jgi:hypothetical protein
VIAEIQANEAPLAYFQPKFIVDQVLASCKFEGVAPAFTKKNIEDALTNLYVKESQSKMFGVAKSGE